MLPKTYSSGPSRFPIATSGTSAAWVPHTLPDRVRTTVVSPMVSTTCSCCAWAPPSKEPESVPQAMSEIAAAARAGVLVVIVSPLFQGRPVVAAVRG